MSETKWTPGPWYATSPAMGFAAIHRKSDNKLIFHVANPSRTHGDPETSDEEKEANLRIAATAPDLYEALERALCLFSKDHALDHFDWGASSLSGQDIQELNELPGVIRAALAKARGEA